MTLSADSGKTDTYGVTGFHKWYSESRGWVSTVDLQEGEELRTATGTARVTTLTSLPGTDRVYNFTVEQDHVYYVGDLTTLTHNNGCGGENPAAARGRQQHKDKDYGPGYEKEVRLPSGKVADAVNVEEGIVKELKPNNPRAIKRGERQAGGYAAELEEVHGKPFTP